jgi:hypothetical protein
MKTKKRRILRKKQKQTLVKRGGAERHFEDKNLSNAYRSIYGYTGSDDAPDSSYWLNDYLQYNEDKESADYKKIKNINDMLITGYKMMSKGYKDFDDFMTN